MTTPQGEAPTPKLTARGEFRGKEVEAEAINPGNWFGCVWLVHVDDCFDPPFYAVEAGNCTDAEDEFVDSPAGADRRITPDSPEADDYGHSVTEEVRVLDATVRRTTWTTLTGRLVTDPKVGKHIHEPRVTGTGNHYDGEAIKVDGTEGSTLPWPCRYFGPGLPEAGVDPRAYARAAACETCRRTYYPEPGRPDYGFCSPACALKALDEE